MAASEIAVSTTPPLPGTVLVQQINDAFEAVATQFSGAVDPAAYAKPYSLWADTGTGNVKRRNAANSAWDIVGRIVPAVTEDASGNVTFPGSVNVSGGALSPQTGFKNRIINGAMTIDQRNAGATVTTSGAFAVDRFIAPQITAYTTLTVSVQQSTDAPVGFNNSLRTTIGTAQAVQGTTGSLRAADHRIEGYNFADLNFGTANAQTFTLSFWVKSSIAGTYPVSFFNAGVTRAYLASYTISAANTWEKKTITVAGDTSGTWNTTNGIGLGMQFAIAAASGEIGTVGSWSGTYKIGVSGMPDVGATSGATWAVTGVQLEKGSTATPFEFRSIGTELGLCQRYFQMNRGIAGDYITAGMGIAANTTDAVRLQISMPVQMRAAPTGSVVNCALYDANIAPDLTAVVGVNASVSNYSFTGQAASGLTTYRPTFVLIKPGTANYISLSAEL